MASQPADNLLLNQCLSQDLETGCLKLAVVTFFGIQLTLSCWYSLEISCHVLISEYQCARVPVFFFQHFSNNFVLSILARSSII